MSKLVNEQKYFFERFVKKDRLTENIRKAVLKEGEKIYVNKGVSGFLGGIAYN